MYRHLFLWELAQSGKSGGLINRVSRVQISYSQLQQNIVIKFMKRRVTNMKSFTYKKTEITSMKLSGIIDTDTMTISVDETDKSLSTLLSDFNGAYIEFNIKTKDEEELEEPVSND